MWVFVEFSSHGNSIYTYIYIYIWNDKQDLALNKKQKLIDHYKKEKEDKATFLIHCFLYIFYSNIEFSESLKWKLVIGWTANIFTWILCSLNFQLCQFISISSPLYIYIYIYIYIKFSSYNVWKHVWYPALINCQPGVITQFR